MFGREPLLHSLADCLALDVFIQMTLTWTTRTKLSLTRGGAWSGHKPLRFGSSDRCKLSAASLNQPDTTPFDGNTQGRGVIGREPLLSGSSDRFALGAAAVGLQLCRPFLAGDAKHTRHLEPEYLAANPHRCARLDTLLKHLAETLPCRFAVMERRC